MLTAFLVDRLPWSLLPLCVGGPAPPCPRVSGWVGSAMVSVNAPLGAPVESPYGEWHQWSGLGEDWIGQDHGQVGEAMGRPLRVSKDPED